MKVNPRAKLMVVEPCKHGKYTNHGLGPDTCDGPLFTITLDYEGRPLATVYVDVEDVIYAAYAALPDPEEAGDDSDA